MSNVVVMDGRVKLKRGRSSTNVHDCRVAEQVNLYLRRIRFGYVFMCPCIRCGTAPWGWKAKWALQENTLYG
jgi:hypothetical protein